MSVLKNFKIIPLSPYKGATGPRCNFFSSNLQRGPWPGARGWKGGLSPPSGDRGPTHSPSYINILPSFSPHLSPKIPPKIQKKREG